MHISNYDKDIIKLINTFLIKTNNTMFLNILFKNKYSVKLSLKIKNKLFKNIKIFSVNFLIKL